MCARANRKKEEISEKGYNESFNARDKIMGRGNENENFV